MSRTFASILLFVLGCAPAVDLDTSVNHLTDPPPVATEVAPAELADTLPLQIETPSPIESPASPTQIPDVRGGGQLKVLDNAPADRAELLAAYADAVRDQPFKYGDVGAVLEALAVEAMQRIYPSPAHEVVSGIEYSDANGRTIGELDIVVFLTASGDAVMISEVKLSGNLNRAAQKANSQLHRFRQAISNQRVATVRHKSRKTVYKVANFENVLRYGKVGSQGATEHGFDWEIDLTRDEGDQLQKMLLQKAATP